MPETDLLFTPGEKDSSAKRPAIPNPLEIHPAVHKSRTVTVPRNVQPISYPIFVFFQFQHNRLIPDFVSQIVNMLLAKLLFFLGQINFVVASEGTDVCALYTSSDDSYFDCREVTSMFALAVCLLQRNTLYKVLWCTNYDANQLLSWSVEEGGQEDSLDILAPYYDNQRDKIVTYPKSLDGRLSVTPRGLLLVASALKECQHCGLEPVIARCPYSDFSEFISCLCCEAVTPYQISCLEKCIFGTSVGDYILQTSFTQYQWLCEASCVKADLKVSTPKL